MAAAAAAAGADDSPATRAIGARPLTPTSKHRRFSVDLVEQFSSLMLTARIAFGVRLGQRSSGRPGTS